MKVWFDKCTEAIKCANEAQGYGVFYSNKHTADPNIHVHECCEVLFCISGGENFLINDRIYEVNDWDVFVINQYEPHKITYRNDTIFERFALHINPVFLFEISTENTNLANCFYTRSKNISNKIVLSKNDSKTLKNLLEKLKQEEEFADDIVKKANVTILLAFLNHFFIKDHISMHQYPKTNTTIMKSLKYINDNLSSELSLEVIAKNSFISINQLCNLFKKHIGTTVNKYIVSRRITEAKKMLNSGASVTDTAIECGFRDYANFIRTFKSVVGISPGKYSNK